MFFNKTLVVVRVSEKSASSIYIPVEEGISTCITTENVNRLLSN